MENFQSEKFKQISQTFEMGFSIVLAILAEVMMSIGYNYTYTEDKLCPNGAAW